MELALCHLICRTSTKLGDGAELGTSCCTETADLLICIVEPAAGSVSGAM